ncbi:MAG: hypothetical protein NC131_12510 [Roseburia sp.]|nr:hypothetical protein [Roseburia sp.]
MFTEPGYYVLFGNRRLCFPDFSSAFSALRLAFAVLDEKFFYDSKICADCIERLGYFDIASEVFQLKFRIARVKSSKDAVEYLSGFSCLK